MSLEVGSLEIKLFANLARLQSDMDKANRTVGAAMSGIEKSVGIAKSAFAGLVGGSSLASLARISDSYKKFDSQLKLASRSASEYNKAYADTVRISTLSQSSIENVGTLYARVTNNLRAFGATQKEVASITETVTLGLRVSNATTQESASVMLQLSQAFGAGRLNGQEFSAIVENAPILMTQLAKSMGVAYGELKQLGADGKITGQILKKAFTDEAYLAGLREQVKQVGTISSAFTVFRNSLTLYIGEADKGAGTSKLLTQGIIVLAENINNLVAVAIGGAIVAFGRYTASVFAGIAATVAESVAITASIALKQKLAAQEVFLAERKLVAVKNEVALSIAMAQGSAASDAALASKLNYNSAIVKLDKAQTALAGKQLALNAAMVAGTTGATLFTRAIGFLGGPIGTIITLLGSAAFAFVEFGKKADPVLDAIKAKVIELNAELAKTPIALAASTKSNFEKLGMERERLQKELDSRLKMQQDFDAKTSKFNGILNNAVYGFQSKNNQSKISELQTELNATLAVYQDFVKQMPDIAKKASSPLEKLPEGVKLLSAQIKEQQEIMRIAKLQIDANKLSQSDYNTIVMEARKRINDLTGATKANKDGLKQANSDKKYQLQLLQEEIEGEKIAYEQQQKSNYAENVTKKAEAAKEYTEALNASLESVSGMVAAEEKNAEALQRQIDVFGSSEVAISALEAARLMDAAAAYEQNIALAAQNGVSEENIQYLQKMANYLRDLAKARELDANNKYDLESKQEAKKLADEQIKEAKRAQQEIENEAKRSHEEISKSLTDSIFRGFENGKSFAENFRDSIKNMFKTLVLQPLVKFIVDSSGITKILSAVSGLFSGGNGSASAVNNNQGLNLSSIKDLIGNANNSIGSFISGFGGGDFTAGIARGVSSGVGFEEIGNIFKLGFTNVGEQLGAIGGTLAPYAGAILQLAQGNIAGAAFTAAGAAIGGPIGAAIGSIVGSLFGGKKKIPRFSSQVLGAYDNGTFTSATGAQQYKPLGAEKQLAGLSEQFALTLGSFLKGFALDDAVKTQADLLQKRKSSYGLFSATFDGGSVSAGEKGKAKNVQKTFEALVENVLGPTIVQAIQKTNVDQAIKDLFRVDEKKEQVVSLINASVSLQNSQKELAERFGLTVGKAAEVSKATGKVGDALATFVSSLASAALAFKSPAQALLDVRDSFGTTLNNALGTVITTAVTEQVAVAPPVSPKPTALQTLFGANGNNGFSLSSIVSAGLGQASSAIKSATQTVYESVTKYVETILPASVKLPASLAEFDTRLKDIDKSTATGVKQFADLFGIREQFAAYQAAVDSLKTGVQGSVFALSSESEQEALKVKALSDAFASLGLTAPTSREELIKLAQGLDYSTKSGLELANALPSLTTAWLDIKDNATNAADAIKASFQELYAATKTDGFKTYIDYIGYLATGRARGKDAANDQYFTQDYANTVASNNQNQFAQANAEKQAAKKDKTTEEQDMLITVQKFGLDIKDDLKSIVKTLAIIQNDGLKVANA